MTRGPIFSCTAAKFPYNWRREVNVQAGPVGPPSWCPADPAVTEPGGGTMFTQESSYTYAVLAALTVAVVATFVALIHAFSGSSFLA